MKVMPRNGDGEARAKEGTPTTAAARSGAHETGVTFCSMHHARRPALGRLVVEPRTTAPPTSVGHSPVDVAVGECGDGLSELVERELLRHVKKR